MGSVGPGADELGKFCNCFWPLFPHLQNAVSLETDSVGCPGNQVGGSVGAWPTGVPVLVSSCLAHIPAILGVGPEVGGKA